MAKASSGGEFIYHVAGVRLRVQGSGNLRMFLRTLDNIRSFTVLPLVMAAATDKEPTRLGNLRSQRIQLELRVNEIDEHFKISKIIIFAKASGTDTPH